MLVLSHDDVLASLAPQECAQAMAEVLAAQARGETYMPLRSIMAPPTAQGFMGLMPAWRGGTDHQPDMFSLKAICLIPANPARGLDAHQGLVALFDGDIGTALAVLDASAVTAVRTAAVSAVATDVLASPDASVLAILGAGVQARSHLAALLPVRRFDQVRVYAPTHEHAQAAIESIGRLPNGVSPAAAVAASAEDAVRGAHVVVTATSSRSPVLDLDWLEPGAHLNAVGASTPAMRELTPETVAACALFADSRESLRAEAGEFRLAVERGLIDGESHVRGELGEVLASIRPGRRDAQEITLFRSLGLAVEDLAAARLAVRRARSLGRGIEVEM